MRAVGSCAKRAFKQSPSPGRYPVERATPAFTVSVRRQWSPSCPFFQPPQLRVTGLTGPISRFDLRGYFNCSNAYNVLLLGSGS